MKAVTEITDAGGQVQIAGAGERGRYGRDHVQAGWDARSPLSLCGLICAGLEYADTK
jgi:hypothetical protein